MRHVMAQKSDEVRKCSHNLNVYLDGCLRTKNTTKHCHALFSESIRHIFEVLTLFFV